MGWFVGLVVVPMITPEAIVTVGVAYAGAEVTRETSEDSKRPFRIKSKSNGVILRASRSSQYRSQARELKNVKCNFEKLTMLRVCVVLNHHQK